MTRLERINRDWLQRNHELEVCGQCVVKDADIGWCLREIDRLRGIESVALSWQEDSADWRRIKALKIALKARPRPEAKS